jgi:hypothetical protein
MSSRCPSCFQFLPADEYQWVCRSGQCPAKPDEIASKYAGIPMTSSLITRLTRPADAGRRWNPARPACAACKGPCQEVCPRCHHALMDGWRAAHTTCIAMNGARATGKSLFIAVLVKQLDQLMGRLNTTIEYANEQTRDVYTRVYEQPLYEARGLMAPTPRANTDNSYHREPLIFSLGIFQGSRRFLIIRDVAGEDMEDPPSNTFLLAFLAHADAVFFMFDPLAVPEIRAKVQDLLPGQLQSGGDPRLVLGNLLRLIGPAAPRLAVILSKFDAMQELRNVDDLEWQTIMSHTGAAFLRDPSLETAHYDSDDGDLLHHEVRSLLHKLNASGLVRSLENPHGGQKIPYRFFAVSALGESPRGEILHARGIAPFRCLDPLKWALANTGAF